MMRATPLLIACFTLAACSSSSASFDDSYTPTTITYVPTTTTTSVATVDDPDAATGEWCNTPMLQAYQSLAPDAADPSWQQVCTALCPPVACDWQTSMECQAACVQNAYTWTTSSSWRSDCLGNFAAPTCGQNADAGLYVPPDATSDAIAYADAGSPDGAPYQQYCSQFIAQAYQSLYGDAGPLPSLQTVCTAICPPIDCNWGASVSCQGFCAQHQQMVTWSSTWQFWCFGNAEYSPVETCDPAPDTSSEAASATETAAADAAAAIDL